MVGRNPLTVESEVRTLDLEQISCYTGIVANKYEYVRKSIEKRAEFVRELKQNSPCSDCGVKYPYFVMDFDHRGDVDKEFSISVGVRRNGFEELKKEIEKCDIVCANCHRYRTQLRLDGGVV